MVADLGDTSFGGMARAVASSDKVRAELQVRKWFE